MKHQIKIKKRFYEEILAGRKTFEIRKNDRNYQKGDLLTFIVINDGNNRVDNYYLSNNLKLEITSVFTEEGFGLESGYAILSFIIRTTGKL